ncbi:enoyl-CoA hydratase-related protein [Deinococcus pimensis]|uniref:enoyl-CoA hydratase-related protein n=1 Tax=Deinococcus pimensis TaxID=309888 RepID=UPI0004807666|nr:enoyl-CoA hydratase-related protein [Deinococcus pimensis]
MTLIDAEFENLLVDQHGPLAVITVNRPRALNALSADTFSELAQAVELVMDTAEIGALILTGGGDRAFVAGADITELADLDSVFAGRELSLAGQDVMQSIASLPLPTIAAIQGFALGGGLELALACDVRIASPGSKLGMPETGLGLIPGYGGTQRLPRLIGVGRALDLMLTARQVGAEEALTMGLVNYVADNPLEKAREVAQQMLRNAPMAIGLVKEAVRRGMDAGLDHALEIEADMFGMAVTTKDFKEGTRAFLEKRPARFQGE